MTATKTHRYLLTLRNYLYLRHFEDVIRGLAAKGHAVDVVVDGGQEKTPENVRALVRALDRTYPRVTFLSLRDDQGFWTPWNQRHRDIKNILHYRAPFFAKAPALRHRADRVIPGADSARLYALAARFSPLRRALMGWHALLERPGEPDPAILDHLRETKPDAVIVSPLVDFHSSQVDWVNGARKLGIPSCLLVASWDNLTTKGLVHAIPDRVVLWNSFQKTEAIDLHGIPEDRIRVTGAQLYDQWFARTPSRDYATFCRDHGFDPAKPILLYCGSSIFIARNEDRFVRRWIEAIRASDSPHLREANILVRPHPMHQGPFRDLDLSAFGPVSIHPRDGGLPVEEDSRADYYDTLYHCSAVVGINTSALIEAAILGKRSFGVADPENARTQEGTIHFGYLTGGGVLRQADTIADHLAHLTEELSGKRETAETLRAFIQRFVRPEGLDKPATPIVIEELEALPSRPVTGRASAGSAPLTPLLRPFAARAFEARTFDGGRREDRGLDRKDRRAANRLWASATARGLNPGDLAAMDQTFSYRDRSFVLALNSKQDMKQAKADTARDNPVAEWLSALPIFGATLYDIGAGTGAHALIAVGSNADRCTVLAFEANPLNFDALQRNLSKNGAEVTVTALPFLLAEGDGLTPVHWRSRQVGECGLRYGSARKKSQLDRKVATLALDDAVTRLALPAPTHLRIGPAAGAPDRILTGGKRVLSSPDLLSVCIEGAEGDTLERCAGLLGKRGFLRRDGTDPALGIFDRPGAE